MSDSTSHRALNPEQKKAVEFGDGPLLIIAGAGTGKTTVVTERIKHLISSGRAKPQEILALTFTEKASREMEERVDQSLPYGVTQMWISTFHSFCDRILRAEGLSIGLDPNYKLMTEAETIQFFRTNLFQFTLSYFRPLGNPNKFISGMIQHFSRLKDEDVDSSQYMSWVKNNQSSHKGKHQVISGSKSDERSRTRFLDFATSDVASLEMTVREEEEKYRELAGAYKTYEELKIKNSRLDFGDLIAYTLKLFRTRKQILQKYQEQFKYLLIDEFQDTNFAQNELALLLAGEKQNITVVGDDDQAIYRWRGAAISNIIQFRKHFKKAKIVVLTKNYRSTKEILDRSYELIQHNNPDRLEVAEKVNKKLECIRRINGTPINLIYVDRVENEAEEAAKEISNLKSQIPKYQWKDFAILVRANAHAEPFVRALSRHGIPYQFLGPGQLFRQPEIKDLICYLKVLYDIYDTVSLFRVLSMDHFAVPPRDIASLVSYARKQGMSLFEVCELGYRRALIGNKNFDPSSVASSHSPLAITVESSEAGQNFISSRRGSTLSLPPSTEALNPSTRATPLQFNELHITEDGEKKIVSLMEIILKHLSLIKKETAGQILYFFLEESGLLKTFTSYKTEKEEKAAGNIAKFFDKLKTYEMDHEDASVFTVVDWLDLSMELGESPLATNLDWNTTDAVNILTVHSAKGLEFPVVFLVNLVGARFPTTEKHEQIPIPDGLVKEILPTGDYHEEEERRLFYVGMTRARDQLFFTASQYYGEGKREKKISPFVIEALGSANIILQPKSQNSGQASDTQLMLLDWKKTPEQEEKKTITHPISSISYSQLETFERCPLQYKYRSIVKIPVPSSAALVFGDVIHRSLQAFYEELKKGTSGSRELLLNQYEKCWKSMGYKNREYETSMYKRGHMILSEYFIKGFDPDGTVLSLEQPFKIKITPTLTLGGKIDRIDRLKDGKLEIIDYKTGSSPKKRNPQEDVQLSIYALAASEKGLYSEKLEHIIVSFYFLEDQEKISSTRTEQQLKTVKEKVSTVADAIMRSDFRPTPGKHCDFCEFRLLCEAWK